MRKKPMLAYPVSDKPIDYTQPVFMQPKLDGVRCLIQYERRTQPREDVVVAYSRTGKEWKNINHILQSLLPFFQANPNVILDGELYNHALRDDFEKIISCVRKTKPTDIDRAESRKLVQFHCYDIVDESLTFEERNDFIRDKVSIGYSIKSVITHWVESEDEAKVRHQYNLSKGYEGSILRLNDVYQCKRSHSLRKFKDFHDAEATLTSWVEGKGSKEATFTYFERTKAGSYRHPLFKAIRDYE